MPTSWWSDEYDNSWERTKEAFRRDWEQTKHDFGGDAPDLNQQAGDTLRQAAGKQPIPSFEESEAALRYGHAARLHYGSRKWDDAFAQEVSKEYTGDWNRDHHLVKHSYERTNR